MGQRGGNENAIRSLTVAFNDTYSEAILLIDLKNAFTSLNRDIALENIEKLCLSLYHYICNSYCEQSVLFINKQKIISQEDTNQGDPFVMSMYGFAIIALIELLDDFFTVQKWYADNCTTFGSPDNLKNFFDSLKKHGSAFGYHLTKCHIFTKEHLFEEAHLFENNFWITTQ